MCVGFDPDAGVGNACARISRKEWEFRDEKVEAILTSAGQVYANYGSNAVSITADGTGISITLQKMPTNCGHLLAYGVSYGRDKRVAAFLMKNFALMTGYGVITFEDYDDYHKYWMDVEGVKCIHKAIGSRSHSHLNYYLIDMYTKKGAR